MAVASAGPYASLHLAPDRQPRQHPTAQFLPVGCPSCCPTNSVKALKASQSYLQQTKYFIFGKFKDKEIINDSRMATRLLVMQTKTSCMKLYNNILLVQSNSSMHHYDCIELCKDTSLQRDRFCSRSLALYFPRSSKSKDRSS